MSQKRDGRKRAPGTMSADTIRKLSSSGVDTARLVNEVYTQIAEFLSACPISLDQQANVVNMLDQEVTDKRAERSVSFSRRLGADYDYRRSV